MTTRLVGISVLEAKLYERLTTNNALIPATATTSTYRIYNYVPANATLPYVSIGGALYGRSESFYNRDDAAEDIVLHVHVWSSYRGDKEAAEMMNNISSAVTSSALAPTGYTVMLGQNDFAQIMIDDTDPNNLLRHGVIRFRFQMA